MAETKWRHFADDIFRCIFVNAKFCILIKISLKFVPKGPIYNNPKLDLIMAWRRTSHYLSQCWPDSSRHICRSRERWDEYNFCGNSINIKLHVSFGKIVSVIWHRYQIDVDSNYSKQLENIVQSCISFIDLNFDEKEKTTCLTSCVTYMYIFFFGLRRKNCHWS